jgi:hypothetical protein
MTIEDRQRRRERATLHLLDEHLIAIGHVAVRSATIDIMIDAWSRTIMNQLTKTARDRLANLSTPQKLDLIGEALSKDIPKYRHAITSFIQEVKDAREERSSIIHHVWEQTESQLEKELLDPKIWTAPKSKKTAKVRKVSPTSMMMLAEHLIDLSFEFTDWGNCSEFAHLRTRGALRGIRDDLGPPPCPPRTSEKDYEEGLRRRGPRSH